MRTSAVLKSLFLAASPALAFDYIVRNWCPAPIEWFDGGVSQGTLATGESAIRLNQGTIPGFIYTSANGGVVNGNVVAARAGFFFEPNFWYYYLVRDSNSNNFNTGISVTPSQLPNGPFCTTAACTEGNCTTAYRYPPRFRGPPPADLIPLPPTYQCKIPETNFDITFCPGGNWPQVRGAPLLAKYDRRKCLDVRGAVFANGTPVQVYDCNDTNAQRWFLSYGSTKVQLAGTNFCLDAGSNPSNGGQMKIWQCYDNLPAQQWILTDDHRLVVQGTSLCLDLPDGNMANGNVIQTWTCSDFNANQAWGLPDVL